MISEHRGDVVLMPPRAWQVDALFGDASCREDIARAESCANTPRVAELTDYLRGPRYVAVDREVTEFWAIQDKGCQPVTPPPGRYFTTRRLEDGEVRSAVLADSDGVRLRQRYVLDSEGVIATLYGGIVDLSLATQCEPWLVSDLSTRCVPWEGLLRGPRWKYFDPACSEPVGWENANILSPFSPPRYVVDAEYVHSVPERVTHIFELGSAELAPGPIY